MGYNYYILVHHVLNMNYFESSGSYGLVDTHYFMSHMDEHPEYTENLNESLALLYEMGEYQYIFSYETIKKDLQLLEIDSMFRKNFTRKSLEKNKRHNNEFS